MCFAQSHYKGNHRGGGAAEGRTPSCGLALNKAHILAPNTAHVLHLNKADVLALNKAHVLRLNNKICPVFTASAKETTKWGRPKAAPPLWRRPKSAHPLELLPVLNAEKLVLEQHSFTFADFCCPRPPLGLLPVPVLSSELVLEQHSFTFPKAASFVLAVNTGHILLLSLVESQGICLFETQDMCCVRARTCASFRANAKVSVQGQARPSAHVILAWV